MQFTDGKLCLTDRQNPIRTVRTEFNPSKNIKAKQRNILSVDNDIQFTDSKVCLTDRQKPIRTVLFILFEPRLINCKTERHVLILIL